MLKGNKLLLAIFMTATLCAHVAVAAVPAASEKVPVSIVSLDETYAGNSYSDLIGEWCQWALGQPDGSDPIGDTDGSLADVGQQGNIWFLAGDYGGSVTRNVEIPRNKALFFPIVNCWASYDGLYTAAEYWDILDYYVSSTKDVACTIDGVPVTNIGDYLAKSSGYPDAWGFEVASYPDFEPIPMIAEGYWLLLRPLPPGQHTIQFHGATVIRKWHVNFSLDVTYHITVAP